MVANFPGIPGEKFFIRGKNFPSGGSDVMTTGRMKAIGFKPMKTNTKYNKGLAPHILAGYIPPNRNRYYMCTRCGERHRIDHLPQDNPDWHHNHDCSTGDVSSGNQTSILSFVRPEMKAEELNEWRTRVKTAKCRVMIRAHASFLSVCSDHQRHYEEELLRMGAALAKRGMPIEKRYPRDERHQFARQCAAVMNT